VTGCQLRIIFFVVELLMLRLDCVLAVVGPWNRPRIYFYIVIFLGKFVILFIVGWVSVWPSLVCLWIISTSLVLLVVCVLRGDNLLCNLFGMQLCGKYGKKEITCYSMAKKVRHIRLLIRLSHSLIRA